MSEEIKPGQKYKRHEAIYVTGVAEDRAYIFGTASGFCYLSLADFKAEVSAGVLTLIGDERTYTAADIERIVAIAARHQREACETRIPPAIDAGDRISKLVINTTAPTAADVLAEFEKMNNPNGDTQ